MYCFFFPRFPSLLRFHCLDKHHRWVGHPGFMIAKMKNCCNLPAPFKTRYCWSRMWDHIWKLGFDRFCFHLKSGCMDFQKGHFKGPCWKSKGLCEPGQVVPPQPLCSLVSLAQPQSLQKKTCGCWLPKIGLVSNQVSSRKGQGTVDMSVSLWASLWMYLWHFVPMWLHRCLDTCLSVCFYMFYNRPHCLVSMDFRWF